MFQNSLYFIAFLSIIIPAVANGQLAKGNMQLPAVKSEPYKTIRERSVHYLPQGTDFVTINGNMRFNRALYGTNTGFRIETGDLPEFAVYMPGMGGNFKFGLISGNKSKWLTDAKYIK